MIGKNLKRSIHSFALMVGTAVVLSLGCSKKQDASANAAPSPTAPPVTADAAAPSAQDAPPAAPSGPVLDTAQMEGDAKRAMAEADAALRQKEYEKAVRTMLAIQQAQLSAQQAAIAHQQMINLQRNLAGAIANGDPNAIAAGQILRAAHSH